MPTCSYCYRTLPQLLALQKHICHDPVCSVEWSRWLKQCSVNNASHAGDDMDAPGAGLTSPSNWSDVDTAMCGADVGEAGLSSTLEPDISPAGSFGAALSESECTELTEQQRRQTWDRYVRQFPQKAEAGKSYGQHKTDFEQVQRQQEMAGESKYAPFKDRKEWEMADWLVSNIGQNKMREFLKLDIVRV